MNRNLKIIALPVAPQLFRRFYITFHSFSLRAWHLLKTGLGIFVLIMKWLIISAGIIAVFIYAPFSVLPHFTPFLKYTGDPLLTLEEDQLAGHQRKLQKDIAVLDKKLLKIRPGASYLVINSTANEFALYRDSKIIRTGLCSTGSYVVLESNDNKKWKFKTPRGEFSVKSKTVDPVWKKPDWAFVEEGLAVPPPNDPARFEYGVLGDYALNLGNGYLIHGTLYQRLLGMPVTHGCIRLNDADLELVYRSLPVGAKVYIY